jgi:hypothetical protein
MSSSVVFNGFDLTATSGRGGVFKVLGLDGWHSLTFRRDRQEKSQQAGSWSSTGFAAGLPITVRGQAVYASAASAAQERREFLSLASVSGAPMTVVDAYGAGTRTVEVDSFTVSPVMDRMFTYALTVTATDPLLYGDPQYTSSPLTSTAAGSGLQYLLAYPLDYGVPAGVTPGAVSLPNAGTASYYPRIRINGPVTNPVASLSETGDQIAYTGTIPAGSWVDINAGKPREVLLGGQVSQRYRTRITGNALAVPVGGGSLVLTADSAGSGSSVDAWFYTGAWV